MKRITKLSLISAGLSLSSLIWAVDFPITAGVDHTPSLGQFAVRLNEAAGKKFGLNCPGDWDDAYDPCVIWSPVLAEDNTKIGRSAPHNEDDNTDEVTGAEIGCDAGQDGCPGTGLMPMLVKDSHLQPFPEKGFVEGPTNTKEVHTQILSLNMIDLTKQECPTTPSGPSRPSANALRAGGAMTAVPPSERKPSLGEVESLNQPTGDFPAESFFNMFVEADVDWDRDGIVDMTVYNPLVPLTVQNAELLGFPPQVVYVHGGNTNDGAPPVYDVTTSELIGWIILAGHGVGCRASTGEPECTDCMSRQLFAQELKQMVDDDILNKTSLILKRVPLALVEVDDKVEVVTHPPLTPLPLTMNLTIAFGGNGHGRVTTSPGGIDCNSGELNCSHAFGTASWIKLTATPATDSKFIRWGGQSYCEIGEVFMNAPQACIAYFELLRVPLTVTTTGQGKVSSEPAGVNCGDQCRYLFDINTKVTLTAIPDNGWQFQEWGGDCNQDGQVVMNEDKTCQATFSQLPTPSSPLPTPPSPLPTPSSLLNPILTACADAITWDGQTNENAVVKNTDLLNITGSLTPIKVKALCNYGTIQETTGELLSIQVNSQVGFIYNEGSILGKNGQSSTAKSTIPTNLVNQGDNGSSIKLKAGTQLYNTGLIQAGFGGNGYLKAGSGGSVAIYADDIFQTGIITAGHGGEGNAHQPEWDGVSGSETSYGNQPVWGGNGGKTLLYAKQSLQATATAITLSGMGGNAYIWCQNGVHLIDWWFDGRWWTGTCVSDSNLPVALPTTGKGGDLIQLSPSLNDLSQASSGKGLYYEPNAITLGSETQLQAQEDIQIFGGDDWVLDLRHLSPGAISTPGNITLAVGSGGTIDLRGNTDKIFQAGGQFTVFTDTPILLEPGIALADLVESQEPPLTNPSQIFYLVVLTGPEALLGTPQTTLPIELELVNGSPKADVYNLTVSDSAGWNLTALPSLIPVEALGHETLMLNATLPATNGEKDTITITATSQTEPTVTSSIEFTVKVVAEPTSLNEQPVIFPDDSNTVDNIPAQISDPTNSTTATDDSEIPAPVTDNANQASVANISLASSSMPLCYASGFVDWVCNAHGQQLMDLTVGPNGILANGTLIGTLTNQGWVSNLTLEPNSRLIGGIVTGYIINHGEMADFEFRGAAIVGGTLAGHVVNTSSVGGYFRDVQLAANTHLSGGRLASNISGNAQAPALLEHLEIQAGSYLEYVTIGDGVKLATDITWGEGVQFNNPSDDPRLVSKQLSQPVACDTQLPSLGVIAINSKGQSIENKWKYSGGIAVNSGSFEPTAIVQLTDTVAIHGMVCVDPEHIGQLADLVVYLDYQPLNSSTEDQYHYMLDPNGEVLPWDGKIANLVAFQTTMLSALQEVFLYNGQLATTGKLKLLFGYRLMDGTLVSNERAIDITILDKP